MARTVRQTFFTLVSEEDQEVALKAYKEMIGTNKKNGEPYILSVEVFKLHPDPRTRGFTIMARTVFATLDDMRYYDEHDEAHFTLKGKIGARVEGGKAGIMVVYMPEQAEKL